MNAIEKANFITASRDAISKIVAGVKKLEMLSENATAAGGLASVFSDEDFTGSDAGITAATLSNFYSTNLPALETALFTGSEGGNKTNTYGLTKIALL